MSERGRIPPLHRPLPRLRRRPVSSSTCSRPSLHALMRGRSRLARYTRSSPSTSIPINVNPHQRRSPNRARTRHRQEWHHSLQEQGYNMPKIPVRTLRTTPARREHNKWCRSCVRVRVTVLQVRGARRWGDRGQRVARGEIVVADFGNRAVRVPASDISAPLALCLCIVAPVQCRARLSGLPVLRLAVE